MTVGEKIREARIKKGISQTELATLLGYKSRSSINKIEIDGRDIPRSSIIKFANVLDVTPAYLMGWEDDISAKSDIEIIPNNKIHMVPVYESVSAGFGATACSDIIDYMPLYITNDSDVDDMLCIKVKGNSMYPKIEDGDIVVVRKQASIDSGSIAVVLIDQEEGLVKKVVYGDNWIELQSINPEYPPKTYNNKEVLRVSVVGLVKQIIKTL